MNSTVRGWSVPLAAALGVFMMLVGMHQIVTGGAGSGQDQRVVEVPTPRLPPREPEVVPLSPSTARIIGYRVSGHKLTITYLVLGKDCTKLVVQPFVKETVVSVTVALQRAPAPEQQLFNCPDRPYEQTVDVRLVTSLGTRVVRDAARDGLAVSDLGG